jgi:hypothetical protein
VKKIFLLAALAACGPDNNVPNRATEYAMSLDAKATCSSWGRSHDGDTDAAFCRVDDVIYKCVAGVTQKPQCDALADLNATRRAQRAAAQQVPAAPATVPPAPQAPPAPAAPPASLPGPASPAAPAAAVH